MVVRLPLLTSIVPDDADVRTGDGRNGGEKEGTISDSAQMVLHKTQRAVQLKEKRNET